MTVHRLDLRQKRKSTFRDFFPICFIALFGCFGFTYIFNSNCIPDKGINLNGQSINKASHALTLSPLFAPKTIPLKIEGSYTTDKLMQFEILDFNSEINYSLQISNGDRYQLNTATFDYGFTEPGSYDIHFEMTLPGKKAKSWTRTLTINDTEMVAEANNSGNI